MNHHTGQPGTVDILVAEDSSTQALSLQYLLEQQGYRVTICENGRKALESAKRRKPTLVISDIVMPELDGYGLCQAFKADPDLAEVPVLLVTTLNDPEDVLRGLEAGADSFILKPYDDPFLLNRVQFVLLHRQLRRADRTDMGVEISFKGRTHFITSDRLQILNLLLSTYEAAIQRNDELRRSEDELRKANRALSAANMLLEQEVRQRELAESQVRALSTELLRASEAQLQQSEERFRQLLDIVPAAIYATDAEGRIREYNRAAAELWGREPPAGIDCKAFYRDFTLSPTGSGDDLRMELGEVLCGSREAKNAEITFGRARGGGADTDTVVNTALIRLNNGPSEGAIHCLLDVTSINEARQRLRDTRELAQVTLDALRARICVIDEQGTILTVNGAWRAANAEAVPSPEGKSYLELAGTVLGLDEADVAVLTVGLREMMAGRRQREVMDCRSAGTDTPRWYNVRARRFVAGGVPRVIIAQEDITEQKEAKERLEQKTAILRIAGDMARFGGWEYSIRDEQLVITDETAGIHDLSAGTPLTADEAIDFYAPDHRERIRELFTRCLESGEPFDVEMQLDTAKSRRIWVRSLGNAVRDEAGAIIGAQGALQDISIRKQQEERLARTAERLTTTLESITDAFFTLDRDWRFTYINREAERLLERSRDELIGSVIWQEFADAKGTEFERQYLLATGENRAVQFESHYSALDLWVEVHAYPSEEGLAVYFRDITHRKRAEMALRKSEESLRLAVTAGGLGTWHWDIASCAMRVSAETRAMYGFKTPDALSVGDFFTAVHPDDRDEVQALAQQAQEHETDFRADFRVLRPDGSVRWIAALGRAYADPDSPAGRMEGVSIDITERKQTERELLEVNEQLEQRVEQRTCELQAAKRQAEAANEAKSAFLATMSHEIRTPMNGIVGMVDILAHGQLSEHQADAVRTVQESALSLLHLIDDVLDFSKIEAGRLDIERTPVVLSDLVEGVCDTLGTVADHKGVELFVYVTPEAPTEVWTDPVRLRQILYNLLGNAIKFSGGRAERPGRVDIRVELASRDPFEFCFIIADNGIGISEEARQHIFESFRQAEVSTTRRFGGTGLGLAICKSLVDLMGGAISIEGAPGVGTTFTVRLPFEEVLSAPAISFPDLSGLDYVLVDGPNVRAGDMQAYLEHAGARVHRAEDEASAVRACATLDMPIVVHGGMDEHSRGAWLERFSGLPSVRHLVVSRGRRRAARVAGTNVVTVDGNSLRRRSLLHAAAVAAGRASPATELWRSSMLPRDPAPPAPTIAGARKQHRLVLVAEDDATNQKVLLQQLHLLGYAAEVAANGREALALWRKGNYALLLTDLHMPIMDGCELAATIRSEEPPGQHLPILALTANAVRGESGKALIAGMDDYLTKPLRLPHLREVLEKWIRAEEKQQDGSEPEPGRTSATEGGCPLDLGVLRELVGDDDSIIAALVIDYRSNLEGSHEAMLAATAAGNAAEVGMVAHRLKSASRSVGALPLGDACAEIENAARLGDSNAVRRAVHDFETAYGPLVESLSKSIAQLAGGKQGDRE